MNTPITTEKAIAVYVTAREARTGKSKTITLRGDNLSKDIVIDLILKTVKRHRRKAG